jgi:hypothetical protein
MSNEGILFVLKYYQDGATRGAHAAKALALRERFSYLAIIKYSIVNLWGNTEQDRKYAI